MSYLRMGSPLLAAAATPKAGGDDKKAAGGDKKPAVGIKGKGEKLIGSGHVYGAGMPSMFLMIISVTSNIPCYFVRNLFL